jgi:transcriptional regulator with XRE-family HTH domain
MLATVALHDPVTLRRVSLRQLRLERVLTQRELAAKAGVAAKTVVDIETGKIRPHPSTLRKLAAALEVPPSALAEHLAPGRPREQSDGAS